MRDSLENEIPHIQFKDVSFSYLGEKENLIFKCNFSIKKPGFWMVVGKNGSGKSTLLKLINGIINPKNGVIDSNASIGMVFQNPDHQILMPNCRSELLININQNISQNEINKKIEYVLDQVGMAGFEKRPVHTLSGGQKQRLTIACALISNRNFILLDEPTNHLDLQSKENLELAIKNYKGSLLIISHDRYFISKVANRIVEIKDSKLFSYDGDYEYFLEKQKLKNSFKK